MLNPPGQSNYSQKPNPVKNIPVKTNQTVLENIPEKKEETKPPTTIPNDKSTAKIESEK